MRYEIYPIPMYICTVKVCVRIYIIAIVMCLIMPLLCIDHLHLSLSQLIYNQYHIWLVDFLEHFSLLFQLQRQHRHLCVICNPNLRNLDIVSLWMLRITKVKNSQLTMYKKNLTQREREREKRWIFHFVVSIFSICTWANSLYSDSPDKRLNYKLTTYIYLRKALLVNKSM